MTTDQAYQAILPDEVSAPASEIAAYFQRVAASSNQLRLRGTRGTAEFEVLGAGTWRITVNDGLVTVTDGGQGATSPADCVLTCTADDFLRIVRNEGHMNVLTALLQGRVTLRGDLPFAWMLAGSFEFAQGDVGTR